MSLILNDTRWINPLHRQERVADGQQELSQIDRYLAILKDNQNSCKFVPTDAFLALDMANFVRDKIDGSPVTSQISVARLALAIVQPCNSPPLQ